MRTSTTTGLESRFSPSDGIFRFALRGAQAFCAMMLLASGVSVAQDDESWSLIWADEFESEQIDRNKWTFDVDCWGGGNDERQCYTDRLENARIESGHLVIAARQEDWSGASLPLHMRAEDEASETVDRRFTSARLTTRGLASWRYGRFEIRAQLPFGQGVWPAIWMLPEDNAYGGWAASGEIDIMEAVNLGAPCDVCNGGGENRVFGSLHFGGSWPDNDFITNATTLADSADGFHVYAVEWKPAGITWFVDGVEYARLAPEDWRTDGKAADMGLDAPFDRTFHLILNLAIGGRWPEGNNAGGVSESGFPKTMKIDWVRVYAHPTATDLAAANNDTKKKEDE